MSVQEVKTTVAEVVHDILSNNKRRALDKKSQSPVSIETTELTPTECADKSSGSVACYTAIVKIVSKVNVLKAIVKLKDLLVKGVNRNQIVVYGNKGHYPYVNITNKTPYDTRPNTKYGNTYVMYQETFLCSLDRYSVASGQTWTASSRGACLVNYIAATILALPDGKELRCTPYTSWGTTYGTFFLIMKGEDACCVQSSHQSGVCA